MMSSQSSQRRRAPTIFDVAAEAGVSKSTVSNVLQGKVPVLAGTRQRVLDAMDQLGYEPNAGARYMRQRSRILGVVVGDLQNPFYAELAAEIEESAAQRNHTILLATTGDVPEREVDRVRTLVQHRVAAMIFLCIPGKAALRAVGDDVPSVFAAVPMRDELSIAIDSQAAAELAVSHLVELGHAAIGFVSVTLHEPPTETVRFDGYRRAMQRAGLKVATSRVLRAGGRAHHLSAYQAALSAFLSRKRRPTAIVAATDFDALEVISAADALGMRVPSDLSVVGFDNISLAGHSRISLTTISQPLAEIAKLAVDAAIDGMPHTRRRAFRTIKLRPELIVRTSTGPVRLG